MYPRSKLNWLKSRIFCQVIYCLIGLTILQVIGNKISYSKYNFTESFNEKVVNSSILNKN